MRINKFEDLDVWKAARVLTNMVYDFTSKGTIAKDFGLKGQIQEAAVSTMSNIAEGFDSGSDQQFVQFLIYTRRSASEVQSELYVALDRKYISDEQFIKIYGQAQHVRKLTNGLIRYLKKTRRPADSPTRRHNKGFTFIELMITLMVVSICFVPIMRMFSTTLEEIAYIDDLRTGIDLAREEIEKVKNLALSERQIKMMGNVVSPPIYLNGARWRTARTVKRGSEPLEVTAYAFREEQWGRPTMTLVTLIKK